MCRKVIPLIENAYFFQQRFRFFDAFGSRPSLGMDRRFNDVFEDGPVRPQVEALEDHGEAGSDAVDLPTIARFPAPASLAQPDKHPANPAERRIGRDWCRRCSLRWWRLC